MADPFVRACRWAAAKVPTGRRRVVPRDGALQRALELAGLPLAPEEVRALAILVAILTVVPAIAAVILCPWLGGPWFLAVPALAVPAIASASVLGHPEARAARVRRMCVAETPALVGYLAMSLSVCPSLDRAIAFAAEHAAGPTAALLRRVLWDVHLRARMRIEDASGALAERVGTWNGELKQALHVVIHAAREGSPDGLPQALDRAREIAYEGARRRWQDYGVALKGPTSALFALGVLLPMIVGSMLPLLSLGAFSPSAIEVPRPPTADPVPWILLLDVAFPAATFAFAYRVSAKHPGVVVPRRSRAKGWPLLGCVTGGGVLVAVLVIAVPSIPLMVPFVTAVGCASVFLFATTRHEARGRKAREALSRDFPDALFQLGSRLGEGRGLEEGLLAVADASQGTGVAPLFARIARSLRLAGGSAEASALGSLPEETPAPIRASLRMVVDIAAQDPAVAGRAIVELSSHLRDLQGIERDLAAEIRPTVDAMRTTALVFAPIVLGVTGALYELLGRAFATIASLPMDPSTFLVALGVYLVFTSAAILYFVVRIEARAPSSLGASLARALPVGTATFLGTWFAARLAF